MKKGYFKKNHNGQNGKKKNNIHAVNFSLKDVDVKLT